MGNDSIETRTCRLWHEAGLLRGQFHDGAEVTAEDAQLNLAQSLTLNAGRRMRTRIDVRAVKSQTAEARSAFAGPVSLQVASAVALLVGSPLSRVLGSFFLRFNRPEMPTRLFTSEADAQRWLREFPE
jgi:hypothetical protein